MAATCRAAVDEGWQVQERDGTVRPARLRDIAVLMPARTGLSALEEALRARRRPLPGGGRQPGLPHPGAARPDQLPRRDRRPRRRGGRGRARCAARPSPARTWSWRRTARDGLRFNYLAPALDGARGPVAEGLRCLRAHHARAPRPLAGVRGRALRGRAAPGGGGPGGRAQPRRLPPGALRGGAGAGLRGRPPPGPARLRRVARGAHRGSDLRPRRRRARRRRGRGPDPDRPRGEGAGVPDRDPGGHRAQPPVRRAADGLAGRRRGAGDRGRDPRRPGGAWRSATSRRSRSGRRCTRPPSRPASSTWRPPAPATT